MPNTTLVDRFPRPKSAWLDAVRPAAELKSRAASVTFMPRLQRKHPLRSRMSGIVF